MMLNYKKIGYGEKKVVIMHGLFGSSDNWQTLAKQLEDADVILPDLRNHGKSFHSDAFTYDLMAEDIAEVIAHEGWTDIYLVGHSMGGKVAVAFAMKYPWLLHKLVVIDISTKQYPMHHQRILEGLTSANLDVLKSRKEVEDHLSAFITEPGTLQFLMKNLYWREKGKLGWRINVSVLQREMPEILRAMEGKQVDTTTVFVRGELSNYILESDYNSIRAQFPDSEIITVKGVGHWVHAEAPDETLRILNTILED